MGCCSSGELEPPSITCSDSSLIHELETNLETQHISSNSLMILLNELNQQKSDKGRLEIIKKNTNQKFILDDFDAILSCFTTSNGKLSATRILKKSLIGTQFNPGFLIKHFEKPPNYTNNLESPNSQPLILQNTSNEYDNLRQTSSYT